MNTRKHLRRTGIAAMIVVGAALAASPAQAIPTNWSGPNTAPQAHCVYSTSAAAPDWCSGTGAGQD
ncbi:hypothetical protein [Glycomyces algeriensis]|uniref:Uncharacterized protein n=1 Tax=Glycomyces algeriensis TaxID=256037 RepID=A0A9W6GDX0_9ACTN|nr:hypothetical protein [Glycomyces algeriensis]MDA1366571.1 hypothetical protein [Glycomyces algeriensis]MDR7352229.1 hypothetical protein [Glycomyces algeriensis]GLI44964.1 hypothetical protein GALLR39Z86_48140 [Glycomyces algeriensis]